MDYRIRLIRQKEIARETRLFAFEKPKGFSFRAGQCADINLLNPKFLDNAGVRRTFSIASAPYEKNLAFAVRMRGSAFKRSLEQLTSGEEVLLEGPMGSFGLHKNLEKPAILIAGGIGITPFISILRDSHRKGEEREIVLLYSNRSAIDVAFYEELEEMAGRYKSFGFVPTLTRPGKKWRGETGRIGKKLLTKYLGKMGNSIFYVAGTLSFVVGIREKLLGLGVSEDDIRTDEFPGY